ncbi:hypothetical protein A9P82_11750 [Arachidicoccus ginsenosidimutans]|uniref:FecR family protein n=1 Tax=Arachidicoccus sp. BS20 TaxID=1850526 RepID=UPI0007F0E304|nr:FecR domain-containing protein [Arachidicoccus sp. BS20]ANI89899.1 hypothetical protein A9P82_11750 [Arachidicoccus sp. BS20]
MVEKLIKKYFSENEHCSDEEKTEIYRYLKNHPSEFLEYFSEDEWNIFLSTIKQTPGNEKISSDNFSDTSHPQKSKATFKRIYFTVAATAACILLFFFMGQNKIGKQRIIASKNVNEVLNTPPPINIKHEVPIITRENLSDKTEYITLPDSSRVQLFAGGKISYKENFDIEKRDIFLVGTAVFKVAKDAKRPFTVFCNEVATTALGTEFKVNSNGNKISVKLIEGKILVRSTQADSSTSHKIYYMLPGKTILFDRTKNTFEEDVALNNKPRAVSVEKYKQFDDRSLAEVLNYLAEKYRVKIIYPENSIAQVRFVGTLYDKESVESILENISLMNGMKLSVDSTSAVRVFTLR